MENVLKDVRVPGVLWAALLIIIIALVHENEVYLQTQFGLDAYYIDLGVGLCIAALKGLKLGTEQLNLALDIIERLLAKRHTPGDGEQMRSAQGGSVQGGSVLVTPSEAVQAQAAMPERPNNLVRFLLG